MRAFTLIVICAGGLLRAQAPTQTNSIGMEFVLAPAGEFTMGRFQPTCAPVGFQDNVTASQHEECVKLAQADARPGFPVKIARPFYMGKFEVTQEQYEKVMGSNPSFHTKERVGEATGRYPVESVGWSDAQAFVKKLNVLEKTRAYRLPTAAEWEYAARAGTADETQGAKRADVAWFMGNSKYVTHPIGQRAPNAWGLHDMLGNVWEWVQDFYDEQVAPSAPSGPAKGKVHVLRGGGFNSHDKNVRTSAHIGGPAGVIGVGFRVVREVR